MIDRSTVLPALRRAAIALLVMTGLPASAASRADDPRVAAIDAIASRYALAGEILVARGRRIVLDRGYGPIAPAGRTLHKANERWRLASITKQVTAALLMRDYQGALDRPWGLRMNGFGDLTLRQLLTHHSGLANPDATPPGPGGVPGFYLTASASPPSYCMSTPPKPGSPFSYNNCDYILAAYGHKLAWPGSMAMARPGEIGVPGFVEGKPEPRFELASWGAAGGLMGTARAVFDFDRSLMTGALLPAPALADLWKPEGSGSYQALGQWVFPGRLKGCAAPKRIVQRDGEIYGVQARNFILPEDGLAVIVFTNRSSDDFAIGEVWQGKGFAYDLLSAVACG